ncbi:MAG: hypothetical protein Q9O24_07025 [Gammaproteobacteria bacterium]|nr:hypothetical protein [Gammaproteobacteria bacterium]
MLTLIVLGIWFGIGCLLAGISGVISGAAIGVVLWWLTPSLKSFDDYKIDNSLNAFQQPLSTRYKK